MGDTMNYEVCYTVRIYVDADSADDALDIANERLKNPDCVEPQFFYVEEVES